MLLTLLQATAQASNAASRINVEQLLDRLLNWGIEVGKDILAAIWLPLSSTSSAGLSSSKSADWSAKFWKNVNWKSVYRHS